MRKREMTLFKELWDSHGVPDPLLGTGLSSHRKRQIWGSPSLILQFNFDQQRKLDGYWLFMVLFKDLQGKKDGSAQQGRALGKLSQGSWPFSGVWAVFCFRNMYTCHWGLWAAGIHLIWLFPSKLVCVRLNHGLALVSLSDFFLPSWSAEMGSHIFILYFLFFFSVNTCKPSEVPAAWATDKTLLWCSQPISFPASSP